MGSTNSWEHLGRLLSLGNTGDIELTEQTLLQSHYFYHKQQKWTAQRKETLETTGRFRLKSFFHHHMRLFLWIWVNSPKDYDCRGKTTKSSLVIVTEEIIWFTAYKCINNCLQIWFTNGKVLIPLTLLQHTWVLIQGIYQYL